MTALLYWPGLGGGFFIDDLGSITTLAVEGQSWAGLVDATFGNTSGPLGRPVTVATFVANLISSGPNAWAFKYTNLMLHLMTGLTLFWLGGRLLSTLLGPLLRQRAWALAALAAFLWLIHPLQVSTVLYAVQRMAQLSFLFTVLALLSYSIGRERLWSGRRGAYVLMLLGLAVFGPLALLSKENGALLPLFIIALELIVFRLRVHRPADRRWLLAFFTASSLVPVGLGLVYAATHFDTLTAAYLTRPFDLTERLMTESRVMFFYLRLILLPTLGELSLFHDDFPISRTLGAGETAAIFGLAALGWAVIRFRRSAPVLSLGIAWFLISHVLESTFIPLELVFEHRNYGASYGVILILAYYVPQAWPKLRGLVNAQRAFLLLYLTTLAFFTHARAVEWGDYDKMLLLAGEEQPLSSRVQTELANQALEAGDYALGRQRLRTAQAIEPDNAGIALHLLGTYCHDVSVDEHTLAEILTTLETRHITPYAVSTFSTLRGLVSRGECTALTPGLLLAAANAVLSNTDLSRQPTHHALVYVIKGRIQIQRRDFPGALASFAEAERLAPGDERPLLDKAMLQIHLYDTAGAQATVERLRALNNRFLNGNRHKTQQIENLLQLIEAEIRRPPDQAIDALVQSCGQIDNRDPGALAAIVAQVSPEQSVNHLILRTNELISNHLEERCSIPEPAALATLGETLAAHAGFGADPDVSYEFLLNLARLNIRLNRPSTAIIHYTRASEILVNEFAAPFELAYLQLNTGDIKGAVKTVAVLSDRKYSSFKNFSTEIDELEMLVKRLRDAPHV